ncbi:putative U3 small nucleolar RNA-associated protein 11 [Triangularia verruculosa]|uniref:U3 small nucleolar RNA-associated protein 11 n=1 Tax=Triangularia verruculosa TaxID=2587418 RepID=A0AAN6XNN4_9PEZI|nr:putative U3 small nucleolar RNA-associated protein 11 [Triangularia verruculosa]
MSSLRNSVQRRSHRERAQPLERTKLGLLEKKKDYQKRAKDYKKKQTVLKSLREKAAEKNEDEFYFGMMSRAGAGASTLTAGKGFDGTVQGNRGNKAMDVDLVRLLKTQDLGYVRTVRNIARKEVRQLEERWILAGGQEMDLLEEGSEDDEGLGRKTKKIVFFDGEGERRDVMERKREEEKGDSEEEGDDEERRRKELNLEKLAKKLREARKKLKALADAELELEVTQAKMAKTATSGGVTKSGKRMKVRERKR